MPPAPRTWKSKRSAPRSDGSARPAAKTSFSVAPFTVGLDGFGPMSAVVLLPSTLCSGSPAPAPGSGSPLYVGSAVSPVTAWVTVADAPPWMNSTLSSPSEITNNPSVSVSAAATV